MLFFAWKKSWTDGSSCTWNRRQLSASRIDDAAVAETLGVEDRRHMWHGSEKSHDVLGHGQQDGLRRGRAKADCEKHGRSSCSRIAAALLREMAGLEGQFNLSNMLISLRLSRDASVRERRSSSAFGSKWQMQFLWNVELEWKRKQMGLHVETRQGGDDEICSFLWTDTFGIPSHSKTHQEQVTKDFIEEAEGWDLEPEPASLWWTSTDMRKRRWTT